MPFTCKFAWPGLNTSYQNKFKTVKARVGLVSGGRFITGCIFGLQVDGLITRGSL